MRGLKVVLVVLGMVCFVSCVAGVVLPWGAMVRYMEALGLQAPAGDALVVYCVRLASLGFCLIGVFFLVLATDPLRYRPMLVLAEVGLWLMAGTALATGCLTRMRPPWYFADFGSCLLAALLILVFWPKQAAAPGQPSVVAAGKSSA